ncbi:MAG: hypothetical protein KDA84_17650, partial [Planctomycetaceae bacterium]|nr:hypothetical protein [Planctomycetaceae bacterium]
LPGCLTGRRYERGCVEGVVVSAEAFLEFGEDIFRAAPIRFVQLTQFGERGLELAGSPLFQRVRFLSFKGGQIPFQLAEWGEFFVSNQLTNLVGLDLSRNSFSLTCLTDAKPLQNLKILGLENCNLRYENIQELIQWPGLEQIEELYLSGNDIGDRGARALFNSERIQNLRILDLSRNQLTGDSGYAVGGSKNVSKLEHLDLSYNENLRQGAEGLETSDTLHSLVSLHVRNCKISREVIAGLTSRFEEQLERGRWRSELTRRVAGLFCSQRYQPRRWKHGISNGVPSE